MSRNFLDRNIRGRHHRALGRHAQVLRCPHGIVILGCVHGARTLVMQRPLRVATLRINL